MAVTYRFNSLEDFLASTHFTVDGVLDDGWGAAYPVKGCEITATILFCDISNFSGSTWDLSPTEQLIYVNMFFAWITAEGIRGTSAIVERYFGDEIMLVFSTAFGSRDPLLEALQTARHMGENDVLGFGPHMGLASGRLIVGYVGTPLRYTCSVIGNPVVIVARCASSRPSVGDDVRFSASITFPASEWQDRTFTSVFPNPTFKGPDGTIREGIQKWQMVDVPRSIDAKNIGLIEVREVLNRSHYVGEANGINRAQKGLSSLRKAGRFWPAST